MVEKALCTGCGACAAVCKRGAVAMKSDREGFSYPDIDASLCVHCGLCNKVCPLNNETAAPDRETAGDQIFFGARAKREETRLQSSSGGIFPLLAEQVLRQGGVVFGASLLSDGTVRHIGIERPEDIPRLTKTKYVQSDLSQMWREIQTPLREGRQTLFCGTPCQAAALRSYAGLRGEGENLLTAGLVCYGVPSPGIWKKYVRLLERKYKGGFQSFSFRDKRNRDNGHACSVQIGGREYTNSLYEDLFCRTYFRNINIRPSCYQCRYCTTERDCDITLGDFWGIEKVKPEFDDGMGCSAVICHTPKGRSLWSKVQDETDWFSCSRDEVANEGQPRLREPIKPPKKRDRYMRLYQWLPFPLWIGLFRK